MVRALVLNAISPQIGGVLIRGEKGTAKSTAVRSLAPLLPEREVVEHCRCFCAPDRGDTLCPDCRERGYTPQNAPTIRVPTEVVELPLNATEDRVAGTLDIEHALRHGEQRFEPSILARANGNVLYVDEVNLLEDHIVDMLLDAAAMGVNHVEREGVSFAHASRFVLVGTMNPEEGDIRPQLLDRFGVAVDVAAERDLERRMAIVEQRITFDTDPAGFAAAWRDEQTRLAERIARALELNNRARVGRELIRLSAEICIDAGVDGHRADITIVKAASALAALDGRGEAARDDVLTAASLALPHRTRRRPFEESAFNDSLLEKWRR
jgi:magnesium chelatase subunit I